MVRQATANAEVNARVSPAGRETPAETACCRSPPAEPTFPRELLALEGELRASEVRALSSFVSRTGVIETYPHLLWRFASLWPAAMDAAQHVNDSPALDSSYSPILRMYGGSQPQVPRVGSGHLVEFALLGNMLFASQKAQGSWFLNFRGSCLDHQVGEILLEGCCSCTGPQSYENQRSKKEPPHNKREGL